jgi:hypothetical protein
MPELFTVPQFVLADALEPRGYCWVLPLGSMYPFHQVGAPTPGLFYVSAKTLPTVLFQRRRRRGRRQVPT